MYRLPHLAWCWPCHATRVAPGTEAAAFLASDVHVDVMLLDIRMPGKSGIDVVKEHKQAMCPSSSVTTVDTASDSSVTTGQDQRRREYPIVAMTGHVDIEALQEFRCVPNCPRAPLLCSSRLCLLRPRDGCVVLLCVIVFTFLCLSDQLSCTLQRRRLQRLLGKAVFS